MREKETNASSKAYVKPTMHVVEINMKGAVLNASANGGGNTQEYEKISDSEWDA